MRRKLSSSKTSSWWQSQIMNWSLALSSWENIIIYAIGFHESWRVQNCDINVESRNILKSIQYMSGLLSYLSFTEPMQWIKSLFKTHFLTLGYFYIILQLFFTLPLFPVCVAASQAKQSFAVENLSSVVQGPYLLVMSKSFTFSFLLGPLFKSKLLNWESSSKEHP